MDVKLSHVKWSTYFSGWGKVLDNWTQRKIFRPKRDEVPIPVTARVLWSLASWDCRFEYRGHGCLWRVSVVCCEARDICEGLITHPEESTDCAASFSVI